jgi:hypothetical protein
VVGEQQGWLEQAGRGRHCAESASLCHHEVVLQLLLGEAEHTEALCKCTLSAVLANSSLLWLLVSAEVHEVHRMPVSLCTEYSLLTNNKHTSKLLN